MVTAEQTKAAVSGAGNRPWRPGQPGSISPQSKWTRLLAYLREKRVVRKFGEEDRYELAHEVMVEKVWALGLR